MVSNELSPAAAAARLRSSSDEADVFERVLSQAVHRIADYIRENDDPNTRAVEYATPEEISKLKSLVIPEDGLGEKGLDGTLEDVLRFAVRTNHPMFFSKLYSGSDAAGCLGELLTAVTNTSNYVFKIAPVYTVMEREIIRALAVTSGFSPETKAPDGLFLPGGSMCNIHYRHCFEIPCISAVEHMDVQIFNVYYRYVKRAFPHVGADGWRGDEHPVVLTSSHSHYSTSKGAALLGIGRKNVIKVACDEQGRMRPDALAEELERARTAGKTPFFVNLTAGTTVLGAFDPIRELQSIAAQYNAWVHVDGAWGMSVAFSDIHRHLVDGMENVDSATWNPHKLLGVPLQCSMLLVRDKSALPAAQNVDAAYLFHEDENDDGSSLLADLEIGKKSVQCGRKVDSLKLFCAWRYHGSSGFAARVNHALALASLCAQRAANREGFELVVDAPAMCNVVLFYIPSWMRDVSRGETRDRLLDKVSGAIYDRMFERGNALIDYGGLPSGPSSLRIVFNSPLTSETHVEQVLNEIAAAGESLDAESMRKAARGE